MLDPRWLKENTAEAKSLLASRGVQFDENKLLSLEQERKVVQTQVETLQSQRNANAKAVGLAKSRGESADTLIQEMQTINQSLDSEQARLNLIQHELKMLQYRLPNIPHSSVPKGKDETSNEVLRQWGNPREFDFTPKTHDELGKQLGLIDFDLSAKITAARFVVMRGAMVRLQRALTQFMVDLHRDLHGYQEIYVPYLVNADSLYGTGQLPNLEEDVFKLNQEPPLYLIPTAEVPVSNTVRDVIVDEKVLPLRYVSHTPCFRSEAGSYGRDTKGIIRQHQFEKVELVWIVKPEQSYQALEQLTSHAEAVLQALELPYQVMALCTGDLGFASAKTYDLEVWLPGQSAYREISSCSNCEAFQARRMQARYRDAATGKPELLHTLNGSGLAVGRTLVAVLENYQDAEGNIHIPKVLLPYMGGMSIIKPEKD